MPHPATITAAVFEKILAFLAPLFVGAGTGDIGAAREAASATLSSYGARTDRELRLAALSIAFAFGALDALSRAADPELALNQVMRLRGNANALNRAAQQNETRLEKLRKQPPVAIEEEAAEATPEAPTEALPASSATADLLAFARSKLKSMMGAATPAPPAPAPVVPLSRQQRRAAERKAEKVRQRQQEEARRAQRAAERMATVRETARASA
ncbi:MAG: hypothetical protein P4L90_17115 [Rhodopila sp.]|nr:hypothetical protein [Rhodopila sp.]